MNRPRSDWYKTIWSLEIKSMSWVEETDRQVDFLIRTMQLSGRERVLDLACGFGRHALSLAERGFTVVGVDITPAYIEDARENARKRGLPAQFVCADIRELRFTEEFDVVLNLADGAIGYLENDGENLKIFDRISAALKPGGKHFMDVCSREHAQLFFPKRHWEIGAKSISLPQFEWDAEEKRMLYGGFEIPLGQPAKPPATIEAHSSMRLYDKSELESIMAARSMTVLRTFSDYSGAPDSEKQLQLMVYSQKSE